MISVIFFFRGSHFESFFVLSHPFSNKKKEKEKRKTNLNIVGVGVPAPLHEERDYTREKVGLRPELYQRDVTDGTLSPCNFLQSFQEAVKFAQKPENAVQLVVGLGIRSSTWRTSTTMRRGGLS